MILDRGERMGLDFASEIAALYQVDWPAELKMVSRVHELELPCGLGGDIGYWWLGSLG